MGWRVRVLQPAPGKTVLFTRAVFFAAHIHQFANKKPFNRTAFLVSTRDTSRNNTTHFVGGTVASGVLVTPSGVVRMFGALSDVAPELESVEPELSIELDDL
jgi:hypothetical protein